MKSFAILALAFALTLAQSAFAAEATQVFESQVYFKAQSGDLDLWSLKTPFDGGTAITVRQEVSLRNATIPVADVVSQAHFHCLRWAGTQDNAYCAEYAPTSDGWTVMLKKPVVVATASASVSAEADRKDIALPSISTRGALGGPAMVDATALVQRGLDEGSSVFGQPTPETFVTDAMGDLPGSVYDRCSVSTSIVAMGKEIPVTLGVGYRFVIQWRLNGDHYEIASVSGTSAAAPQANVEFSYSFGTRFERGAYGSKTANF